MECRLSRGHGVIIPVGHPMRHLWDFPRAVAWEWLSKELRLGFLAGLLTGC